MPVQPSGGLSGRVQQAWAARGPLACLLWPLAQIYGALLGVRRILYRTGFLPVQHLHVPVIVVGNVVAGGAGKTPTTLAVARHLVERGWRVGIISRGYGRQANDCREVLADARPQEVGDEPLLLHLSTGCPVYVAPRRAQAGAALLARYPETEVLLCDDGMQHWALYRDLEICVFDDRGPGNGWLLPAGPLREPWPRRFQAASGQQATRTLVLTTSGPVQQPGFAAQRHLADAARRSDGSLVPLASLTGAQAKPCIAVAGIGRPENFFTMLRAKGLHLADCIALPDHADFSQWPLPSGADQQLLCTEKDAAKLWQRDPGALAVPLALQVAPDFFAALDAQLDAWRSTKLSSPHGHPTT